MADVNAYAQGLRESVKDPAAAWRELVALSESLAAQPALSRGLIDAAAGPEPARSRGVDALLKPCSAPIRKLVGLLLADNALNAVPDLEDAFARLLADDGLVRVVIEAPTALGDAERRSILRSLNVPAAKALMTVHENPDLIGGIRATVGGKTIDTTLAGRLDRVAESLGGAA